VENTSIEVKDGETMWRKAGLILMSLLLLLGNNYTGSTNSYPVRWYIDIDWDGNGTYAYDEAIYTLSVDIDRGRDEPFADMRAGQATIILDNSNDRFDIWNVASAIYGKILPGRKARITCTYLGVPYVLYTGRLVDVELISKIGEKRAILTFLDAWYELSNVSKFPEAVASASIYTEYAITYLCYYATGSYDVYSEEDSDLHYGEIYTYAWFANETSAKDHMNDIINSNQGLIFVNRVNKIVFYDRTRKNILRTGHNWALDEDNLTDIVIGSPWDNIINRANFAVTDITKAAPPRTVAYTLSQPVYLAPGATVYITGTFDGVYVDLVEYCMIDDTADGPGDPAYDIYFTENWVAASAVDATIRWVNLNNTTGYWIVKMTIEAFKLSSVETQAIFAEDATSQAIYGIKEYILDTMWLQSVTDAQTVGDYMINTYKNSLKHLTVRMKHKLPDILRYELGDLIAVTSETYDVNDNFRVGAIHLQTGHTMQEVFGEFKLEEIQNISECTRQATWFYMGTLIIGTNTSAEFVYRGPTGTIKRADARVKTAPTGANIICDINKNGASIWTTQANRVTIAAGAASGTQTTFDITTISDGDVLTMDVDQVGATIAGVSLTVLLEIEVPLELA
jgi:hypothetical protein